MKNKRKKTSLIVMAGILMLSLTACSSTESPKEAYKNAYEDLKGIIEANDVKPMIDEIDKLVNYRYSPFDIGSVEFKYISEETLYDFTSMVYTFGDSKYLDITDKYLELYKNAEDYIHELGGVIDSDGSISYPNGIKATIINSTATETESSTEVITEEETVENIENLPNEPGETIAESLSALDITEEAIENAENAENTEMEESLENAEETEEVVYETADVVYSSGKPPVGVDSEGFPIDEDGLITFNLGTADDPRINPIIDLEGNVLWEGCPENMVHALTNDQNKEYLRAVEQLKGDANNKSSEHKQLFEEQIEKNIEIDNQEDTDDGLGNVSNIVLSEDEIVYHMNEFETSTSVKQFDDKYGIEWKNILDYYNTNTGRYEYKLFNQTLYIDLASTYVPISAYANDIEYNFILMDYRVLDNGQILLFYESRNNLGGLANSLVISGSIENKKFKASDINDFTNFYNKY